MNNSFSKVAVWLVIALVLFTVFKQFDGHPVASGDSVSYTQFMNDARAGRINAIRTLGGHRRFRAAEVIEALAKMQENMEDHE